MEFDPQNNNEGRESMSGLRFKIAELERKYLEEKDRYRRDCLALKETVARLEEDRRTLRAREMKDLETIKSLMEQIDAKEREVTQKVVEHNAWVKKCGEVKENAAKAAREKEYSELEVRILKIVEERFHLVEKEKGVESAKGKGQSLDKIGGKTALEIDDELPKRTVECSAQQKSSPGPTRKRVSVVVDSDGEGERGCRDSDVKDGIELSQLRNKKLPEVAEANEDLGPLSKFGSNRAKVTSTELADARTPPESANKKRKEKNKRCSRLNKKTKLSDLSHSSTVRNPVSTVCSRVADKGAQASRTSTGHRCSTRNSDNQKSQRSYTGRTPSSDQADHAKKRAETLQSSLMPCNLSFVRPMSLSHVSGGFWLNLPIKFCKENLPVHNLEMILEDERSLEYKVNYIGHSTALSGGWRGFALAHKLELGDVLLFELHKPARFKIYIVKAIPEESPEDFDDKISVEHIDGADNLANTNTTENQDIDLCDFQMKPPKAENVTPT